MGSGTLDTYPLIADQTNATLGSDVIDFPNASIILETGWSFTNGILTQDGTGSGTASAADAVIDDTNLDLDIIYQITVNVSAYTSGDAQLLLSTGNVDLGITGVGSYTVYGKLWSNSLLHIRAGYLDFVGSIDNVSIKQVQGNPAIMTNQTSSDIENGSPYANILQNGDFSDGTTNWNFTDATGTVGTYFGISEVCEVEFTNSVTIYAWQNSVLTSGKSYKVTLDYYIPSTNVSVNNMDIKLGNTSSTSLSPQLDVLDAWTSVTLYGTADGVGFYIYRVNGTIGDKVYIDNVSVSEVNTGLQGYWKMGDGTNDAYPTIYDQTSNTNNATMTNMLEGNITNQYPLTKIRNYYRMGDGILDGYPLIADQTNPSLGSELVTNGDFATDSDWTKGTGWTISGGVATSDGTATNLTQGISIAASNTYEVTFTISSYTSGAVRITLNNSGDSQSNTSDISSAGTHTAYLTVGTITSGNIIIDPRSNFVGSIDNVSVKQVQGNPGTMTNMSASDIILDTPNEPN